MLSISIIAELIQKVKGSGFNPSGTTIWMGELFLTVTYGNGVFSMTRDTDDRA